MSTTPESIVTSLHWSQMLCHNGFPQAGATFYWNEGLGKDIGVSNQWVEHDLFNNYAAPTAEEILRRLPEVLDQELLLQINSHSAFRERWNVGYWNVNEQTQIKHQQFQDTLANAAAAMYCYLAEQGILPKP